MDRELKAFSCVDSMMRSGKSLFQIYEFLGVRHPDFLVHNHASIESVHIDFKVKPATVVASDDGDNVSVLKHPLEDTDDEEEHIKNC